MDAVMVGWHLDEAWDGCQQHFTNPKNIHYGKKGLFQNFATPCKYPSLPPTRLAQQPS
jgi:hypothetical protein